MIKLELDNQSAWFLTQILDNAIDTPVLFLTQDEDGYETFDEDFHSEIVEIRNKLLEIRGFKL
jgi:hypothetical protein